VYPTEVNRFTTCIHFCFLHIIVLDVNLLKILLTFVVVVNRFANVALVNQKYFLKCLPQAEL
jgi:hypothetical protein